ncbi:MAG: hypothetical protein ACR2JG_06380 [Geodermatophilaceae bacterium]
MTVVPGQVSQEALAWVLTDAETVDRYRGKVRAVPGWDCAFWCGAVSGAGHGRFWLAAVDGRDGMVVAHRFGFALEYGVEALDAAPVLGHRCDNPLCQRMSVGHVVASSHAANRREWAAPRALAGGPLTDRPRARGRARELRAALPAADQPGYHLVAGAGLGSDGLQLPLWAAGRG